MIFYIYYYILIKQKIEVENKYLNKVIQRNTLTILINVPTNLILYIFYRRSFNKTCLCQNQRKPKKNKHSITSRRKSTDS